MELKRIKDGIHYIPNSTNIGVIDVGEKTVILIDTGIDDSIGKRILKLLEDRGLSVVAIINTH